MTNEEKSLLLNLSDAMTILLRKADHPIVAEALDTLKLRAKQPGLGSPRDVSADLRSNSALNALYDALVLLDRGSLKTSIRVGTLSPLASTIYLEVEPFLKQHSNCEGSG